MKKGLLFFCLILCYNCSSPQKYFDKKEYSKAYKKAMQEIIHKNKVTDSNKQIVIQSLEKIIEKEYDRIKQWEAQKEAKYWNKALDEITSLKNKIEQSNPYTDHYFDEPYKALTNKEQLITEDAFYFYKNNGIDELDQFYETKQKKAAQRAHQYLSTAKNYIDEGIGLDTLIATAYENGIVNIYVEAEVLFGISEEWEVDRMFQNIVDFSGGFINIQYETSMTDIDCEMDIDFRRIDFDEEEDSSDRDYEKEIIVKYETETDTAGNETEIPIYEKVAGEVRTITVTKTGYWEVGVNIISRSNSCYMSDNRFEASRSSSIRQYRIRGDERAIPDEYLDPDREEFEEEDDTIEYLLEELYEQITAYYF